MATLLTFHPDGRTDEFVLSDGYLNSVISDRLKLFSRVHEIFLRETPTLPDRAMPLRYFRNQRSDSGVHVFWLPQNSQRDLRPYLRHESSSLNTRLPSFTAETMRYRQREDHEETALFDVLENDIPGRNSSRRNLRPWDFTRIAEYPSRIYGPIVTTDARITERCYPNPRT